MLQIEEWFRRPQRKMDRREKTERPTSAASRSEEAYIQTASPAPTEASETADFAASVQPRAVQEAFHAAAYTSEPSASQKAPQPAPAPEPSAPQKASQPAPAPEPSAAQKASQPAPAPEPSAAQKAFRPAPETAAAAAPTPEPSAAQRVRQPQYAPRQAVTLPDSVAETEEIDQITEKIGLDVADMIDLEKEDFLLRQIDEFREKARQLHQLMATRKNEAEQLQSTLSRKEAKASELDELITVRQDEANRIMGSVSERIEAMSADVRQEMSGFSDAVSKEVSGLTQNLTHEINQSAESTRQAFETAAQNMIDQNTRSLEGLKEQLEQLGQLEQINELSTEMNSQITTLKSDIADKIHAEDVKCYRNIQASMNEQSKMRSDADERTRQHIQEQVDILQERMGAQAKLLKVSLAFTVLDFLGIAGILAYLIVFY